MSLRMLQRSTCRALDRKPSTNSNPYIVKKKGSKTFDFTEASGYNLSAQAAPEADQNEHLPVAGKCPVAHAHELSSSLYSSLEVVMNEAVLEARLQDAYEWCEEQGAVEIAEISDEATLDDLAAALGLKKMETNRIKKAVQAHLKPEVDTAKQAEAEANARDALQKAFLRGDAGELKLALSNAGKLKLGGDFVVKCKAAHTKAEEKEIEQRTSKIAIQADKIKAQMKGNVQLVLVSSPEHDLNGRAVLAPAAKMIYTIGGTNKAGDAKDWFHSMMMSKSEMNREVQGWRIAWKSKICSYITDLKRLFPEDEIRLLTIAGGPECVWEYEQLKGDIKKAYPFYKLRHFRDLDAFEMYLLDGAM